MKTDTPPESKDINIALLKTKENSDLEFSDRPKVKGPPKLPEAYFTSSLAITPWGYCAGFSLKGLGKVCTYLS